jgi:regulator of protease activity HflC (stomatin/prohibitin superfamily)
MAYANSPSGSPKSFNKLAVLGVAAVVAFPVLFSAVFTINSGERGIVRTFGSVTSVVEDGLHFKIPIVQSVIKVNVKTQKAHSPASAGTKDMQSVNAEVALNYHLDAERLSEIYSRFGLGVENNIIEPRIQEVVKAVVAKYSADQLLSQREAVKREIAQTMKASVAPYFIVVEDIQITNFKFSESFNAAIESKQTAEQSAFKAKNDLERIKIEAEQKIATARAEAEAIRIQSEAVRAQGGKEYVQMKAIEKWDGKLPTYAGGNGPLPFIEVK